MISHFWRQYPLWFFVGNWLVSGCVLALIGEHVLETKNSFQVLDFRLIGDQPSLLIFVLIITVAAIVARAYSAFMAYLSSYSIEEDSLGWLSEEEYRQQEIKRHRSHIQLLLSFLLTLVTFSLHYLVGLFIAGIYVFIVYALLSWLIGLACIVKLRREYKLPSLSTYEYAAKNRVMYYSAIMLLASVLSFFALVFVVMNEQEGQCSGVLECFWLNITDLSEAFNAWLVNLFSLGWLVQGLLLLLFISLLCLWQTLSIFRAKILFIYKQAIFVSLLAFLALPIVALIIGEPYLWLAFKYSLFSLTSYAAIFLLFDVPRLKPKDSVAHRPSVFKAMMKDVFVE